MEYSNYFVTVVKEQNISPESCPYIEFDQTAYHQLDHV